LPEIIESIVSTMNLDGIVNFAPVGIQFNQKEKLLFTVFHSTTTFLNLKCQPCGVVNFTSDVLLFAKTALYDHVPNYSIDKNGKAAILDNADEALEFIVESTENMGNKSKFFCAKTSTRILKSPPAGIIRATGSVIEAIIMVTRLNYLPSSDIKHTLQVSRNIVDKTGGPNEIEAMELVETFYRSSVPSP